MLDHIERTEGLAAIYPAMMNSIFALMALGHGPDDPLTCREIKEFSRFEIEEGDTIRMQPCVSPVWDTCIAMVSLEEAGLPPDHPALVKAADWMLSKQVLGPGDWQIKNKDAEPGGWAFEFRNDFYPDVDDTAFVLMALQRVKYPDPAAHGKRHPPRHSVAAQHAESRRRLGRFRSRQRSQLSFATFRSPTTTP